MKFCYFDESIVDGDVLTIVAGVIVDAQRMHKTKELWTDFLEFLSQECGSKITEFHAKDFIRGRSPWNHIDGARRGKLTGAALRWIGKRLHRVTFSAVHRTRFNNCPKKQDFSTPWMAAAFHCILTTQKSFQDQKKNKGHTVFVFDKGRDEKRLTDLCGTPPTWTDAYYRRDKKQAQLDQMVDVPFFAASDRALLIQVADLVAYVLRRHWEISSGKVPERYQGEAADVSAWIKLIKKVALPSRFRYRSRDRNNADELFWKLSPQSMRF